MTFLKILAMLWSIKRVSATVKGGALKQAERIKPLCFLGERNIIYIGY